MKVSVILPTYNEGGNIVELVKQIGQEVPTPWEHEIIVVDDDSPDGTYETVRAAFAGDARVRAVLRKEDRGLAKSIRCGLGCATGDHVLVMDSDFTHDPREIPRLLHVGQIFDIASGSRFAAGGNLEETWHYLASLFYNWGIRLVLRTQVQDNLGGYFTMRRDKLLLLPWDRIFFNYGDYFFRLIYYAQKTGMTIIEVPAQYRRRRKGQSKSNFMRLFFLYTRALFVLRLGFGESRQRDTARTAGAPTAGNQARRMSGLKRR